MDRKEEGLRIWSRTKWVKSKNRINKYLYSLVKESMVGGLITKLYDEDNTNDSLSTDLVVMCNIFYSSCRLVKGVVWNY